MKRNFSKIHKTLYLKNKVWYNVQEVPEGGKLVSVSDIAFEHWKKFGRNFFRCLVILPFTCPHQLLQPFLPEPPGCAGN